MKSFGHWPFVGLFNVEKFTTGFCKNTRQPGFSQQHQHVRFVVDELIRIVFPNLFWFAVPLHSFKDICRHPWLVFFLVIKIKELQLLAAPLGLAYGTLVCRGTPVGNHWIREYQFKFVDELIGEYQLKFYEELIREHLHKLVDELIGEYQLKFVDKLIGEYLLKFVEVIVRLLGRILPRGGQNETGNRRNELTEDNEFPV